MKIKIISLVLFFAFVVFLTACQHSQSPDKHISETNAVTHETQMPPNSEILTNENSSEGKEEDTIPPTQDEEIPQTAQTEKVKDSSQLDEGFCKAPVYTDSIEEFLNHAWEEPSPNVHGYTNDTVVVPMIGDGYQLMSFEIVPDAFQFIFAPVGSDFRDDSDTIKVIEWRSERQDETGLFDQPYPYTFADSREWHLLVNKRLIQVYFSESNYPATLADLEEILSFEVRYAPESTTAEAETNPVQ